jgi:hypothetical protein
MPDSVRAIQRLVNHKVIAVKLDQVKGVKEHAPVIARLVKGTEHKIGASSAV